VVAASHSSGCQQGRVSLGNTNPRDLEQIASEAARAKRAVTSSTSHLSRRNPTELPIGRFLRHDALAGPPRARNGREV